MKRKYDLIYSLGRDCACSEYLIRAGLRTCSGPFDWITGPKFVDRISFIENDFKYFLNINDLEPIKKDLNANVVDLKNDYYTNTRTKFIFLHDFKTNIPLKESLTEVEAKYNKRIERFYRNINKKKHVLLVFFTHHEKINTNDIKEFYRKLTRKFNKTVDLLIIDHDEKMDPNGDFVKEVISKNIEKYTLYIRTYFDDGVPTVAGRYEICDTISKQFSLCIPFYKNRTFIKHFSKFITIFIPIKGWRKKIREKLRRLTEL